MSAALVFGILVALVWGREEIAEAIGRWMTRNVRRSK